MKNTCPVCGYQELSEPAYNELKNPSYEICTSCNYQFGYDDDSQHITHDQWRQQWVAAGMPWRGKGKRQPLNWNPVQQLGNIGITLISD
jgi:hypothetical protein